MKKYVAVIALFVLLPAVVFAKGILKVVFLDIGQGDAIYIEAPNGKQLLVDSGRDKKVLAELGKVMPFADRSIDVVIATHPDADHVGGLGYMLDEYAVGAVIESGGYSGSQVYQKLQEKIVTKKIPHLLARKGMRITLDRGAGVYADILFPDKDVSAWETNDGSIVARIVYGSTSALLTGDLPLEQENYLVSQKSAIDADVLKLGHHGSRTSSSERFLRAVSPLVAVISAGRNNSYGHPHPEIVERLRALKIPYFGTYSSGAVKCSSDAVRFVCE